MIDQSRDRGGALRRARGAERTGRRFPRMLIQNTNPVFGLPRTRRWSNADSPREDLFVCVHEQFMTETRADGRTWCCPPPCSWSMTTSIRAAATQHIILGAEADRAARRMPSQPRRDLRARQAARRRASGLCHDAARDHRLDLAEIRAGGTLQRLEREKWIDCQPDFETAHYLKGFAYPDGKFRFKPDWAEPCRFRQRLSGRADRQDAEAAGLLDHHRGGGPAASVPPCDPRRPRRLPQTRRSTKRTRRACRTAAGPM